MCSRMCHFIEVKVVNMEVQLALGCPCMGSVHSEGHLRVFWVLQEECQNNACDDELVDKQFQGVHHHD